MSPEVPKEGAQVNVYSGTSKEYTDVKLSTTHFIGPAADERLLMV